MRAEIADPVRDQSKLRRVLPLARDIYRLHEAGLSYAAQLKEISRIVGRFVSKPMVKHAFGTGDPEYFARRLLIDWDNFPRGLSKEEMLELLQALLAVKSSQDRSEYWLKCLELNTGEPELMNLIYWPGEYRNGEYAGRNLSPAEILDIALLNGNRRDA
jgi:hypothetical protein